MELKKLNTKKETARFFDVVPETLRAWEKNKLIDPPVRIGRRVYFTDVQINKILGRSSATQATN